jgi:acetylornithine/N-succinyldiaminopimelate aminotransferase
MKGNNAGYVERAASSLMYVGPKPGIVMERGSGLELFDVEGRRYLDFVGGWAVTALGHCPVALSRALKEQVDILVNASPSYYNKVQVEFAEALCAASGFDKVWFGSSGAEANEGAIKLARKWGRKNRNGAYGIVTASNSFHGRTLATMAATGKEEWRELYGPALPGFAHVPYNDFEAARDAVDEGTVAIMIEPVQGEGGAVAADLGYVRGLRELCDRKGLLLIFDEVQTGYGRTGSLFAYQGLGVKPDIMTLAKGMGAGFPLAALLARDEVCVFEKGDQGGTYSGQSLAMAAGLAVLREMLARDIAGNAKRVGGYLRSKLEDLEREALVAKVRGAGLLLAFDSTRRNGADIVADCLADGLLVNSPRPKAVRLMPALVVDEAQVDEAIGILRKHL